MTNEMIRYVNKKKKKSKDVEEINKKKRRYVEPQMGNFTDRIRIFV